MMYYAKQVKAAGVAALLLGLSGCVEEALDLVTRGLSCYGTEPFWGLTFAGDTATWSQPNMSDGPIREESYAIAQLVLQPPF